MQILLIYNPNAGDGVHPQLRGLVDLIHAAGHEARCRSSKDPLIRSAFAEPADLVAVAGGDGTVAKVARLLRGRKTAIAPLAVGTANNISTALGLASIPLEEQILGWSAGRTLPLDLGVARGPRGARVFLESFGVGLMPRLMDKGSPRGASAEARLASAVEQARRIARRLPAIGLEAKLDGRDLSGRYMLLEAMNIGWVGPNLNLAPDADPADGQFDVVLVRESERTLLLECLLAREQGDPWPHAFPVVRGRSLHIAQTGFAVHVDDKVWGAKRSEDEPATLEVALRDTAWFLVPAVESAAKPATRSDARRDALQGAELRSNLTPPRWAWPAGRRARFRL